MLPEIKIILYISFIVSLFFIHDVKVYIFILLILCIFILKIPRKTLKSGWIPITLLVFFTFLSNIFFQSGKILFLIGPFTITEEGLNIALVRTLRLLFMIAGAKILTATTNIESLVGACGRMLKPLERIGIPVVEFFSIVGLTINYLPRLKDHLVETYKQKSEEDSVLGFWGRIKGISVFLLPLIARSIRSPEIYFKNEGISEKRNGSRN